MKIENTNKLYLIWLLILIVTIIGCTTNNTTVVADEWKQAETILSRINPPAFPDKDLT